MFYANLYREPSGFQDTVTVEVINKQDEWYLKSKGVQVDIIDHIFDMELKATMSNGVVVELRKGTRSVAEAFTALVGECERALRKLAH